MFLFQALSELVLSTPYHKLRFGLLTRLVRHLVNFLNSTHCPTRLESIKCISAIIQIEPPLAEVYELFKNCSPPVRAPLLNERDDPNGHFIRSGAHTPLTSYGLYGAVSRGSHSSLATSFSNLTINAASLTEEQKVNERSLLCAAGDGVTKTGNDSWAMSIMLDIIHNGHPVTKETNNPDQGQLNLSDL